MFLRYLGNKDRFTLDLPWMEEAVEVDGPGAVVEVSDKDGARLVTQNPRMFAVATVVDMDELRKTAPGTAGPELADLTRQAELDFENYTPDTPATSDEDSNDEPEEDKVVLLPCPFCKKKYKTQEGLDKHIAAKHPDEVANATDK